MPAGLASSNFNHWGCNGDGAGAKTFFFFLSFFLFFIDFSITS